MPANKIPVSGNRGSLSKIDKIHDQWCRDNGYPIKAQAEEAQIDYKKFHQMMVTQLKAPSIKFQASRAKQQAPSSSDSRPKRKVQAPSPE